MEQNKQILIDNAILKSENAISSAISNFENKYYSTCQNRLYYAIFYIVSALAYKNDFITSKHAQLMGWFNKEYIYKNKIFDEKLFQIYKEAFADRQKSDYDFMYEPQFDDIKEAIEDTKEFVKIVKNYINKI